MYKSIRNARNSCAIAGGFIAGFHLILSSIVLGSCVGRILCKGEILRINLTIHFLEFLLGLLLLLNIFIYKVINIIFLLHKT